MRNYFLFLSSKKKKKGIAINLTQFIFIIIKLINKSVRVLFLQKQTNKYYSGHSGPWKFEITPTLGFIRGRSAFGKSFWLMFGDIQRRSMSFVVFRIPIVNIRIPFGVVAQSSCLSRTPTAGNVIVDRRISIFQVPNGQNCIHM